VKVLEIGPMMFRLPDDFKGTLSDALRCLADYHDGVLDAKSRRGAQVAYTPVPEDRLQLSFEKLREKVREDFYEAVRGGKRCNGIALIVNDDGGVLTEANWK